MPSPAASYSRGRDSTGITIERLGGVQQHNEDPDSRLYSHSVKVHSSLAGGVVASGSYTLEERENLSRLSDTTGVKHATVDRARWGR